jgi:hypothetical protein
MNYRPFILSCVISVPALAQTGDPTPEQAKFFTDKVLPVLAENCFRCHSAEGGKDKGGLTLDTRDAMLKGGETGPALIPGDIEKSLITKSISYKDADLQMPPKEALAKEQVETLNEWVKMGAPWPKGLGSISSKLSGITDKARQHWAYQPVKKPAVPTDIKNQQWVKTPVDAFILKKLQDNGLTQSPNATPETLIRRVYYDLIGLPPSPAEIDAFVLESARSQDAFTKVVDRLLASPAYGERWGRYWLDTARYSDTAGSNANGNTEYRFPHAWTYRDWVINAMNQDMPYDHFIIHQLASDYLPAEQKGQKGENLAALGFLTVGERFGNQNDLIDERIDTISKAFLAQTVSCARCHDHMFDPITQKDYYAWHGILSSITEPKERPQVGKLPPQKELDEFIAARDTLEKNVRTDYYRLLGKINEGFRLKSPLYFEALTQSRVAPDAPPDTPPGRRPISPFGEFLRSKKLDEETARQLERRVNRREDPIFGPLARLSELSPGEWSERAQGIIDQAATGTMGKDKKRVNAIVAAALKGAKPGSVKDVWQIYDSKVFAAVARVSLDWLDEVANSSSLSVKGVTEAHAEILQVPMEIKPGGALSMNDFRAMVDRLPNRLQGGIQGGLARYNELLLTHAGAPAHAMVVADKPKPADSPVFIRGQANNKGEIVPRRFLDYLSPGGAQPFKMGSGRYELAMHIANKDNPLTARVAVNRIWMHHFGEAFVPTPDDLGNMSEKPVHPELLDYLSAYFVENGWSMKKLHRLICTSHIYMASSHTRKEYEDKDPRNLFFWRANVRRLDFEATRDSLIAMTGKLDRTLGGKPINMTEEPYSFRRSVYGYVDRGNLPELLAHFDFANPERSNSRRNQSLVPQQALFLMNSPMTVDIVRRICDRPEFTSAQGDAAKVGAIYRIILQRNPNQAEMNMALGFVKIEAQDSEANNFEYKARFRNRDRNNGRAAIKNDGLMVARKPIDAWETLAQALLFSNEASYVN